MQDILSKLDGPGIVIVVLILSILVFALLAILVVTWGQARLKESETLLKQQLLAKGFSAAEIEQVVRASTGPAQSPAFRDRPPATSSSALPGGSQTDLLRLLMDHGMEGKGIEQLLRFLSEFPQERGPEIVEAIGNMLDNGMEAGDIERILRAMNPTAVATDRSPMERTERPANL